MNKKEMIIIFLFFLFIIICINCNKTDKKLIEGHSRQNEVYYVRDYNWRWGGWRRGWYRHYFNAPRRRNVPHGSRNTLSGTHCPVAQYTNNINASNQSCTPHTVCGELENTIQVGSDTTNTICECNLDISYESGGNCLPITECTDEQYEISLPTNTSNRVCGTYTTCNDDQYESLEPTPTSDRECSDLTVCSGDEVQIVGPTTTSDRVCGDASLLEPPSTSDFINETPSTFEEALLMREQIACAGYNTNFLHPLSISDKEQQWRDETMGDDTTIDFEGNADIRYEYFEMLDSFDTHLSDICKFGLKDLLGQTSYCYINKLRENMNLDPFVIDTSNVYEFLKGRTDSTRPMGSLLDLPEWNDVKNMDFHTIAGYYIHGTMPEVQIVNEHIHPIIRVFLYVISLSTRLIEDAEFLYSYIDCIVDGREDNYQSLIDEELLNGPINYSEYQFGFSQSGDIQEERELAFEHLEEMISIKEEIDESFAKFIGINEIANSIKKIINVSDDILIAWNDIWFSMRISLKVAIYTAYILPINNDVFNAIDGSGVRRARNDYRQAIARFAEEGTDEQRRAVNAAQVDLKKQQVMKKTIETKLIATDLKIEKYRLFFYDAGEQIYQNLIDRIESSSIYQKVAIRKQLIENPTFLQSLRNKGSRAIHGGGRVATTILKVGKGVAKFAFRFLGSTIVEAFGLSYDIVDWGLGGLNPVNAFEIGRGHISSVDVRKQQICNPPPPHVPYFLSPYPCPCISCDDPHPEGCDDSHPERCDFHSKEDLLDFMGEFNLLSTNLEEINKYIKATKILIGAQIYAGIQIVMGLRGSQCLDLITNDYIRGPEDSDTCLEIRRMGNFDSIMPYLEAPIDEIHFHSRSQSEQLRIHTRRGEMFNEECSLGNHINPLTDCDGDSQIITRWVSTNEYSDQLYQHATEAIEWLSGSSGCDPLGLGLGTYINPRCQSEPCDNPGSPNSVAIGMTSRVINRSAVCPMAQLKKKSNGENSNYWDIHGNLTDDFKTDTELAEDLEGIGICSTNLSNRLEVDRTKNQELISEILEVSLENQIPNPENHISLGPCINIKDWGEWEYEKQFLDERTSIEGIEDNTLSRCAEECEKNEDCHYFWVDEKWETPGSATRNVNDGRCCLKGNISEDVLNDQNNLNNLDGKLYKFNRNLIQQAVPQFEENHNGYWHLGQRVNNQWQDMNVGWTNEIPRSMEQCEQTCLENTECKGFSLRPWDGNCIMYISDIQKSGDPVSGGVRNIVPSSTYVSYIKTVQEEENPEEIKSFIENNQKLKISERAKYCKLSRKYIDDETINCHTKCCGGDCELIGSDYTGYEANALCYTHGDRTGGENNLPGIGVCRNYEHNNYIHDWRAQRYSISDERQWRKRNLRFCDNYVGWRNAGEHEGGCTAAAASDTSSLQDDILDWIR